MFAKDLSGYKNLIKLSSKSFLDAEINEEPHCTIEDIEKYYDGLIFLTGCYDGFFGKIFSAYFLFFTCFELFHSVRISSLCRSGRAMLGMK